MVGRTGIEVIYMRRPFYPKHQLPAGPELRYISRGQKKVVMLANCRNESKLPLRLPLSICSQVQILESQSLSFLKLTSELMKLKSLCRCREPGWEGARQM